MTTIRRAEKGDLPQVERLLKQADLPALDPQVPLSNLLVAEEGRSVVGAIALEVFGRSGLLRGVVVAPEQRGRGLGRELLRSLMSRAHELSLRQLLAQGLGAPGFFAALGFEPVADEDVPIALRRSRAFRAAAGEPAPVVALGLG